MEVSSYPMTWHQVDALALENETLRTVVVPQMGGKIVSLLDKRTQTEWLAAPEGRPFEPVPYGAPFIEQDMSGWDEMFPTIDACAYPAPGEYEGAWLPDHGEVWAMPWSVESDGDQIVLSVEGKALPYRLTRTLDYAAQDTLRLIYHLLNTGSERMPYIWAAHPQFDCGSSAEIILPGHVSRVCNTTAEEWGWGAPETQYDWPEAVDASGQPARLDKVGPASLRKARKVYALPDTRLSWMGLLRKPFEDWLRMSWPAESVPYFGLWVDEGALSHASVVTPEPTTGFYDSLVTAWQKNEVISIEPGDTHSWVLTVQAGRDKERLLAADRANTAES